MLLSGKQDTFLAEMCSENEKGIFVLKTFEKFFKSLFGY